MAQTLNGTQQGVYEFALTANTEELVTITGAYDSTSEIVVIHHSGTAPIYAKFGDSAVTVKDGRSRIVPIGSITEIGDSTTGGAGTSVLRLISAAAAVVSVARGDE